MSLLGIDELRRAVRLFGNCNETFNTEHTAENLLKIYRAYHACGWDITPDDWTPEQVMGATIGMVPEFAESKLGHGYHAVGVNDCTCGDCRAKS